MLEDMGIQCWHGKEVLTCGLLVRIDLNGQRGIVEGYVKEKGRFIVKFDTTTHVLIKPSNLRVSSVKDVAIAPRLDLAGQVAPPARDAIAGAPDNVIGGYFTGSGGCPSLLHDGSLLRAPEAQPRFRRESHFCHFMQRFCRLSAMTAPVSDARIQEEINNWKGCMHATRGDRCISLYLAREIDVTGIRSFHKCVSKHLIE